MGNMSNPCINRWGLNTFWYSFWYSDHRYAYVLQQDHAFSYLIYTFLIYGLDVSENMFANTYWHSKHWKRWQCPTYWRYIRSEHPLTGEVTRVRLRVNVDCIFPMRMWVFRYDRWLIIHLAWFRPFKRKYLTNRWSERFERDAFNLSRPRQGSSLRRMKRLVSLMFFTQLSQNSYYHF